MTSEKAKTVAWLTRIDTQQLRRHKEGGYEVICLFRYALSRLQIMRCIIHTQNAGGGGASS